MTSFYCEHCDKTIKRNFKRKHIKSKNHLYMYNNIVINEYTIGDIPFSDLENIVYEHIMEYNTKFNSFSILVNCRLLDEDIKISIDNKDGIVPLYKFKDIGCIFYEYCQGKKVRDYVYKYSILKDIKLDSNSIIKKLTITIFSKYDSMRAKHRFYQPRSILETKILKQISNLYVKDALANYRSLTIKYELLYRNYP